MDRKKSTGRPGGRKLQLRQDSPKAHLGAGKKRSKLQRMARTNRSNQQCSPQQSLTIGETAQRFLKDKQTQMQRPPTRSQLENQPISLENRFFSTVLEKEQRTCIMCCSIIRSPNVDEERSPIKITPGKPNSVLLQFIQLIESNLSSEFSKNPENVANKRNLSSLVAFLVTSQDPQKGSSKSKSTKRWFSICNRCQSKISLGVEKHSKIEMKERRVRNLQKQLLNELRELHEAAEGFCEEMENIQGVVVNSKKACADYLNKIERGTRSPRKIVTSNEDLINLERILLLREGIDKVLRNLKTFLEKSRSTFHHETNFSLNKDLEDVFVKKEVESLILTNDEIEIVDCEELMDTYDLCPSFIAGEDLDISGCIDDEIEIDPLQNSDTTSHIGTGGETQVAIVNDDNADKSATGQNDASVGSRHVRKTKTRKSVKKGKSSSSSLEMGNFKCPSCPNLGEMAIDTFALHITFHHRRPNKCTECSCYLSGDPVEINKHWDDHHKDSLAPSSSFFTKCVPAAAPDFSSQKIWQCFNLKCSGIELFSSEQELELHEENFHKEIVQEWECKICSKKFMAFPNFRLHLALNHPKTFAVSCYFCEESFPEMSNEGVEFCCPKKFLAHLATVHRKYQHSVVSECPYCGFTESYLPRFIEHMVTSHNQEKSRCFICHICHRACDLRANLNKHMLGFHMPILLSCDICGIQIKRKITLRNHRLQEHGIVEEGSKLYACEIPGCNYKTAKLPLFKRHKGNKHVSLEDRPRPFSCQYCGKGFCDKRALGRHLEIHENGESKPYQCEICGSSFPVENYLYIHKRLTHNRHLFPSGMKKRPRANKSSS